MSRKDPEERKAYRRLAHVRQANRERMRRRRIEDPTVRERELRYRAEHKDHGKQVQKLYRQRNRDEILRAQREWRERHREEARTYARNRYRANLEESRERMRLRKAAFKATVEGKIETSVRNRISKALRGRKRELTALQLLGCTIPEYRIYLEKMFLPGMSWENYDVRTWHIDHIRPVITFDLYDQEQQRKCFHYSNTQPLWALDNQKKKRSAA